MMVISDSITKCMLDSMQRWKKKRLEYVFGPKMWNMLPKDVRLSTSVTSFKTALKNHLFQIAYT